MQTNNVKMLLSDFISCNLVNIDWYNMQSIGSISSPIQKLDKCYLKYNTFLKLNFRKFNFMQSSIFHSIFMECNLFESNFNGCNLKETEFNDCDLQKSDFRKATGYVVNLFCEDLLIFLL